MWTRDGALCVGVPAAAFQVLSIGACAEYAAGEAVSDAASAWRPDGRALLLADKDRFCVMWPNWEGSAAAAQDGPA
jgi:hypothetical protein